jgi:hypothetical protein
VEAMKNVASLDMELTVFNSSLRWILVLIFSVF